MKPINQNSKTSFKTKKAFISLVGEEAKASIMFHPASVKCFIGSKDGGRSFLAKSYALYCMERDPYANGLALKKYITSASHRLGTDLLKSYHELNLKFNLPYKYHHSIKNFYRESKKERRSQQYIEFSSFENLNYIAGISLGNGGYFATVHIEEPIEIGDNLLTIPDEKEWLSQFKIIQDSVNRSQRDFIKNHPDKTPIPISYMITTNNWAPEHGLSILLERHNPEPQWFRFITGFEQHILAGNELLINAHWETISDNLLHNYVMTTYVETDHINLKRIDTLFIRSTKFWNPDIRNSPEACKQTLIEIKAALLLDDRNEQARLLGTQEITEGRSNFVANIPHLLSMFIDTEAKFQELLHPTPTESEPNPIPHFIYAIDIAWDLDPSRRLVGTVAVTLAKKVFDPRIQDYIHTNFITLAFPQIYIQAHKRVPRGHRIPPENVKFYTEQMTQHTLHWLDTHTTETQIANLSQFRLLIDDNSAGYEAPVGNAVQEKYPSIEPSTCATLKKMAWFAIDVRPALLTASFNQRLLYLDQANLELYEAIYTTPKEHNNKRYEKGRFKKLMDPWNSLEYAVAYTWFEMNFRVDANKTGAELHTLLQSHKEATT